MTRNYGFFLVLAVGASDSFCAKNGSSNKKMSIATFGEYMVAFKTLMKIKKKRSNEYLHA